MFGDDILVSPVIKKGQTEKEIYLPKGKWVYCPSGKVYDGGQFVTVSTPIDVLPYFERKGK